MSEKKTAQESEIATLYRLPLAGWTASRNALATRLRGAGRKAEAEAVKALVKPSLSAWAINQLFGQEGERMAALLDAGRQARSAQRDAVAGRGAEAFREALTAARRLAEELRRLAVALLAREGKAPGAEIVLRIATNLEALAFSPSAALAAERGYLDADLDPPGFEVLAGLQLASAPARPPERRTERPVERKPPERPQPASRLLQFKPAQKETAAEAAARRREEAEAARQARVTAKQRERVERAEAVVQQAAEKAKARRGEAAEAAREAAQARRQAEEAERRAESAEAELARARENLAAVRASPGE